MELNINNYEVFIIDYLDGRLGPVETAQLLLFLENHPGLKEEFEDLKSITVSPSDNEVFDFKESLKQPTDIDAVNLSMLNYQHYFVASIEGDLSATGIALLKKFMEQHPELSYEYKLFEATKLKSVKKIKFPDRDKLKKESKRVYMPYYYATGVAAAFLLLMTIYLRLTPGSDNSIDNHLRQSIENQMDDDNTPAHSRIKDKTDHETGKTDVFESSGSLNNSTRSADKKIPVNEVKTSSKIQQGENQIKQKAIPIRKIEKKGMIINNTPLFSENRTRNFYSDLYDDIAMSQELRLVEEEEIESMPVQTTERTSGNPSSVKAARLLSSVVSTSEQVAQQIPESLNGWLFADLGIKGFNLLTNNSFTIDRRYNTKGNLQMVKIRNQDGEL